MSAESNKILCAILSAILLLLLSSFIGELIYHPKESKGKVSYSVEEEISEEIVDSQEDVAADISSKTIEDLILNASLEEGEKFVIKNCSACHSFQLPEKNKVGPSLAKVMNRKIGSLEDYKYSKALQEIEKTWTYKNLYLFLEKPKQWSPGTKMSYRGISKQDKLINVLKYLAHISKLNES